MIQQAGDRALRAGTTLAKVLEIAAEIRKTSEIPLLLFTYLNPALRYGFERLARDAKAAGIDGCLLTDVSVEEAGDYVRSMRDAGLDTVFLAAPTSTEERLKLVAEYSSGFVYLVSRTGITGEQQNISDSALPLVERMRAHTDLPLAMGFGISHTGARGGAGGPGGSSGGGQRDRASDRSGFRRSWKRSCASSDAPALREGRDILDGDAS